MRLFLCSILSIAQNNQTNSLNLISGASPPALNDKTLTVGQSILLLQSVFYIEHLATKWWYGIGDSARVILLIESLFLQLYFNSFPPHTFSKIRNVASKQQTCFLWKFKVSMKQVIKWVYVNFLFFQYGIMKNWVPFPSLTIKMQWYSKYLIPALS